MNICLKFWKYRYHNVLSSIVIIEVGILVYEFNALKEINAKTS
jgi:hypothetical protein